MRFFQIDLFMPCDAPEVMKKKYIAPAAEVVNVRLIGSVLGGIDIPEPSEGPNSWDAKDQELEWEEEAAPTLPRNINLWEEQRRCTDETDGNEF